MNEKILLGSSVEPTVPEGFIKASLTIDHFKLEKSSGLDCDVYGFQRYGNYGNLDTSLVDNLTTTIDNTGGTLNGWINCSLDGSGIGRKFIYKGIEYEHNGNNGVPLASEWKTLVGKTVTVFVSLNQITRNYSGGGYNLLPLHACNSLWRAAA